MTDLTYTPSTMEKLLGSWYKWWYIISFKFKSRTVSFFDSAFFVFGHMLILAGTLITWWLANGKVIDSGLEQKWSYFLIGELFFCLIFTFSEYLGFDFIRGNHSADLLKPQGYIKMKLFDSYGESLLQNLTKFVVLSLICFIFLTAGLIQLNFSNLPLTILILPFGFYILYLLGFIVACSGFFLPRIHGISLNYGFLLSLLMGRIFPLDLLISSIYINILNPFAFTFYHPMQIYLGKYNTNQTILVFLGGIAWCLILYFLAKLVFKLGLKRNESVGL